MSCIRGSRRNEVSPLSHKCKTKLIFSAKIFVLKKGADMILKKEFYFVRHGQTDHNLMAREEQEDLGLFLRSKEMPSQPESISLNDTGRQQAKDIQHIISSLPIKTVCSSPLKRVQETKAIVTEKLSAVDHFTIENLGECTGKIWHSMSSAGMYYPLPEQGIVRDFMERVRRGINEALSLPGPSLIVSHGGVHFALCCLIGIETHSWRIKNCQPVHFSINSSGNWTAKIL